MVSASHSQSASFIYEGKSSSLTGVLCGFGDLAGLFPFIRSRCIISDQQTTIWDVVTLSHNDLTLSQRSWDVVLYGNISSDHAVFPRYACTAVYA